MLKGEVEKKLKGTDSRNSKVLLRWRKTGGGGGGEISVL